MPIQATVGLGASQQRLYDSLPARPMSITSGKFVSLTTHFTEGRGKVHLQSGSAKHLGGRPSLTTDMSACYGAIWQQAGSSCSSREDTDLLQFALLNLARSAHRCSKFAGCIGTAKACYCVLGENSICLN